MRLRSTIEFLGLWEQLHNSNFNMVDFDHFKTEAGSNAFTLSPQQWITSTNAIQKYLISKCLSDEEKQYTFVNEADLLNVALFGKRAYEWRNMNPDKAKKGENIRDYASAEELIVLINLENFNAEWISQGLSQAERLEKLRTVAYSQLEIFQKNAAKRKLSSVNQRLLKGGDANAN